MRKALLKVLLFILTSFILLSFTYAKNEWKPIDLKLSWRVQNVNIFEGSEFNNYPMNMFHLFIKMENTEFGEIEIGPYYFFNPIFDYYEKGVIAMFKYENEIGGIKLNPFYVSWNREGQTGSGFAFWGEFRFNSSVLDLRLAYASSHIKNRPDLNGRLYRLTVFKGFRFRGIGEIGLDGNLIYNCGFFEEGPNRFIYTVGIAAKDIGIFKPANTEVFITYAYSRGVIKKVMIGIKLDISVIRDVLGIRRKK